MKPLNGTRTHELSQLALETLRLLAKRPVPYREINAGVIDRLLRGELVETQQLRSPYKIHKGGNCRHLVITAQGYDLLMERA